MAQDGEASITAAQANRLINLLETLEAKIDAVGHSAKSASEAAEWVRQRLEDSDEFRERVHSLSANCEVIDSDGVRRPLR
jgi:chemotaxis regulatin CheY-phosphate phosphatase CheZ